jgi:hypothetical protein
VVHPDPYAKKFQSCSSHFLLDSMPTGACTLDQDSH